MREWEQILEPFSEGIRLETLKVADPGNHVVARYGWHGVGRGPEAVLEFSQVNTFRKGKIITVQHFWDHDEALEATGV